MSLPGKWEFPGGKVEANERPEEALAREILEELGLSIRVGIMLGRGSATINRRVIELEVYAAEISNGIPVPKEHSQIKWVEADELKRYDWAEADIPALDSVRAYLLEHRLLTDPTV